MCATRGCCADGHCVGERLGDPHPSARDLAEQWARLRSSSAHPRIDVVAQVLRHRHDAILDVQVGTTYAPGLHPQLHDRGGGQSAGSERPQRVAAHVSRRFEGSHGALASVHPRGVAPFIVAQPDVRQHSGNSVQRLTLGGDRAGQLIAQPPGAPASARPTVRGRDPRVQRDTLRCLHTRHQEGHAFER